MTFRSSEKTGPVLAHRGRPHVVVITLLALLVLGCHFGSPSDGQAGGPIQIPSSDPLFRSNWGTALGSEEDALTDGGQWDNTYCSPEQMARVMEVVPGAAAGWTLTPNVLQITNRGEENCALVENETAIPDGVDFYLRLYVMVENEDQVNFHPVKQAALPPIPATFWAIQEPIPGVSYRPMLRLLDYSGPEWNAWWPRNPLPQGTWFRFEFHVDWVDVGQRHFVVWPRIYDMNNRLLYDATSYTNTDMDRTLSASYRNGHFGRSPNLDQVSRVALGYEGTATARDNGGRWYYAALEVRADTWPGPVSR